MAKGSLGDGKLPKQGASIKRFAGDSFGNFLKNNDLDNSSALCANVSDSNCNKQVDFFRGYGSGKRPAVEMVAQSNDLGSGSLDIRTGWSAIYETNKGDLGALVTNPNKGKGVKGKIINISDLQQVSQK